MIGIFDSGIGGLTVARAVMDRLPGYDIVYFGDTARTPYGTKSPHTIRKFALQDTEFLMGKGARLVVMACNTAASHAGDLLTSRFDLPIFEVITPAVSLAVSATRKCQIGVIGTRATVASGVYEEKIRQALPEARVFQAPCPLLVPLVEEGWLKKPETAMIVKKYLHPLKVRQIDTLILGCTHYPVLKGVIQRKIGRRVHLIDSSTAVAATIGDFLAQRPDVDAGMKKTGGFQIFVSDATPQFEKTAGMLLNRKVRLELVRF